MPARSAVARQAFEPNRTRGAGGAYGAGNTTDAEDRGARGASGTSDPLAPLGPTEADGPGGPARPGRATRASTPHLAARANRPLGAVESVRPWGARRSWGRVAIGEMRQRPRDSAAARSAHQWSPHPATSAGAITDARNMHTLGRALRRQAVRALAPTRHAHAYLEAPSCPAGPAARADRAVLHAPVAQAPPVCPDIPPARAPLASSCAAP